MLLSYLAKYDCLLPSQISTTTIHRNLSPVILTMAGKKRAAKPGTKRTAAGSVAAAAAADDKKYHILKLIPIRHAESIALLHAKGIKCDETCDEPHKDDKIKRDPIILKLPLNCRRIADDFIDDYYSDDENTNAGKQSKKPDIFRYHYPNSESYNYDYAVVRKFGRPEICITNNEISRDLCYIGLTNNGEAWIEMRQKPAAHRVHVDGKLIEEPKGIQQFSLENRSVLSFFRQTGIGYRFAYRVEIQSSVLANRKRALCRIDEVIAKYNMCCICRDPFEVNSDSDPTSVTRLPIRGTTCGHHLCESCLDQNFLQLCKGKQTFRYMKCPLCNTKSFDIQNKVKDRLFVALLEARALKSNPDGEDSQSTEKHATDGTQEIPSEVAMLKKEIEELRKKNEEIDREKTLLRKRNEELMKRIEELESKPEAASRDMEETDDSDFEVVEVDILPEAAPRNQEHESVSNSTPDTSANQDSPPTQPSEWKCTNCTLLNPMKRKTCEACGGRREGL